MGVYLAINGLAIMRKISQRLSTRQFRIAISLLISIFSLYLALRNVDIQEVRYAISESRWGFIALAFLFVIINNLIKSERWQILLTTAVRTIRFSKTFMVFMIGQMFNNLLPARFGELSRIMLMGGKELRYSFVVGTLMVEKSLDVISYSLIILVTVLLIPIPEWLNEPVYMVLALSLFVLIALLIVIYYRDDLLQILKKLEGRFSMNLQSKINNFILTGMDSMEVFNNRGEVLRLAFLTAAIWGTALMINQLVISALGLQLPITASLLVLVALIIGISIPSLPGKIGIFEYSCVLSLSLFDVSASVAFSYGILLHIIVFSPPIIVGLISLWVLGLDQKIPDLDDNPSQDGNP